MIDIKVSPTYLVLFIALRALAYIARIALTVVAIAFVIALTLNANP